MTANLEILSFINEQHLLKKSIVETIKAVHIKYGMPLSDAKNLVSEQECWKIENANAKQLHDEAIDVVLKSAARPTGG